MVSACTNMYHHSFEAQFSPPLKTEETSVALDQIKRHFVETGLAPFPSAEPNPNRFDVQIGKGKSGLLREPFEEYVSVARRDDSRTLNVVLTRIMSHPIDFTSDQLRAFVATNETLFHEA